MRGQSAQLIELSSPDDKRMRRPGKPGRAVLKFSRQALDTLPAEACQREYAKRLGIALSSLQEWMWRAKVPLPHKLVGKRKVRQIRRDDLIKWLIATGRCS